MKLIGMLDSPYVRRVAITLKRLGIAFEHEPVSVFSTYAAFALVNPVVKAPTLVTDSGVVLMDSTLIIDYLESLVSPQDRLLAATPEPRAEALRVIGLALAGCEKAVQIVYELNLRPADKHHAPWLDRVSGQLHAACDELEHSLAQHPLTAGEQIDQAGICVAVFWAFARRMVAEHMEAGRYPLLSAFSAQAERLPVFLETPG